MKLITDFDGVLTDLTAEAQRVRQLFQEKLAEFGEMSATEVEALFHHLESSMLSDSKNHGWRVSGRITAYWDEDGFIRNNALAAALDAMAREGHGFELALLKKIQSRDVESFDRLANMAFNQMTEESLRAVHKPLDPVAVETIGNLINNDVEVVVVSNSGTDRIRNMLESVGLPSVEGTQSVRGKVRVRGGARKYELGSQARYLELNGRWIDVSRPLYEQILREEKPQWVIGDVFSLDLALPYYLAQSEGESFGGMGMALRAQSYTPQWVENLVTLQDREIPLKWVTSYAQVGSFFGLGTTAAELGIPGIQKQERHPLSSVKL